MISYGRFYLLSLLGYLVVADEAGDDFGWSGFELTTVNGAGCAVDRHEVTFLEGLTTCGHGALAKIVLDIRFAGTHGKLRQGFQESIHMPYDDYPTKYGLLQHVYQF